MLGNGLRLGHARRFDDPPDDGTIGGARLCNAGRVIVGENDGGATPDTMRAMAEACPGSDFTVVPGAKHVINVDRPDDFAVAVADFLDLDDDQSVAGRKLA